mgnify:CR=1 FL=1
MGTRSSAGRLLDEPVAHLVANVALTLPSLPTILANRWRRLPVLNPFFLRAFLDHHYPPDEASKADTRPYIDCS